MISQLSATSPRESRGAPAAKDAELSTSGADASDALAINQHSTGQAVPHRRWLGWLWGLVLVTTAGAGWHYWPTISPAVKTYLSSSAVPKARTGPRITPVVVAAVQQRELPLYLNGLGTVTALKTVTIRSRVEGELIHVAFREGQMVQEGDLLAEIDPRPFEVQRDQALAQLRRDEAQLRAAQLTLSRHLQLLESKITTQQQVDDQKALVDQIEASIKADQALIATAELQLSYCRIVAPISGRIGLRWVDEGNMVRPTDAQGLAVITQMQPIGLLFTIPQDDIARVQRAMRPGEPLTIEAYDRDFKNQLARGQLVAIDNQVDPSNGTVRLKAEFANDDGMLFPNQFVNVRLLVEVLRDAVVIPSAAVQRGPNGPFVYVVQPDDTVKVRAISLGPTEGAVSAVASGLSPGELVVTEGMDKLIDGARVAPRDPSTHSASTTDSALPGNSERPNDARAR